MSTERYFPGAFDLCTGYEHIHRYLFALPYIKGKKVLDLACGEGYGSFLLSQSALEVVGIDICQEIITHAKRAYQKENLSFLTGSMQAIPRQDLFDAIICFEAIEHILDHDLLCKEIKRVLKPDGILLLSTPNKWVYSENGKTQNPYHLKELDLSAIQTLLAQYFQYQCFYGQKAVASSRIFPLHSLDSHGVEEKRIQLHEKGFCLTAQEDPLPRYFIVCASDQNLPTEQQISYLTDVAARKGYAQWILPEKASYSIKKMIKKFLNLIKGSS